MCPGKALKRAFEVPMQRKEEIKMQKMVKTLREIVVPFIIQVCLVTVFTAAWVYMWIR